jgi:hypothetical protein
VNRKKTWEYHNRIMMRLVELFEKRGSKKQRAYRGLSRYETILWGFRGDVSNGNANS